MILSEAWKIYEQAKTVDGYAESTMEAYTLQIRLLIEFVGDIEAESVSVEMLRNYVGTLGKLKPASRDHRIRFMHSFFRFLVDEEYISRDPSRKIKEKGMQTRVPKALNIDREHYRLPPIEVGVGRAPMFKTYRYRIYPNREQEQKLSSVLSLCCELYNACLEERREAYRLQYKTLSKYDQVNELTEMKKVDERFKTVPSHVLQDVVFRVDKAYQGFFRRVKQGIKPGFPRFKSYKRYDSFTFPDTSGFKVDGRYLILLYVGKMRIVLHRTLLNKPKQLRIVRKASGWYAQFVVEVETHPFAKTGKSVGIDVGIESFLTTSDGEFIGNPKFLRHEEKRLRRKQRQLARCKKNSHRRKKVVKELGKQHEHIANKRRDFAFKVVKKLIIGYDVIVIEDLTITNMVKNHHLAKSINDVAWGMFFDILLGKAEEAGREVIKVNPKNTSQVCSSCGSTVKKDLSIRWHNCPECGLFLHRDINAAINILQLAS